jgi:CRISPR-associated protein Cas1
MKKNLYLSSYKTILKREGNVLKILDKKIPLSMIKHVFIISNATITASARNLLLKHNKTIFYLNYKYQLIGIFTPDRFDSNYKKRLAQYANMGNLDFAKLIVLKKIEAIEKVTKNSLKRYKNKLEEVNTLNEILGVEGGASNYMFSKFKEKLEEKSIFEFKKRTYRPVEDKINGVLSFLYTLYYSYLYAEIIAEGLDPYISFLHIKRGTHSAFVSDMMEEARVFLTWLLLEFIEEIYDDKFEELYLNIEGRKIVLKYFDKFLLEYENSILKEIKELL